MHANTTPPYYEPTPKEEAFGLFLASKFFDYVPALRPFYVEKKVAMKLLVTSGVNRLVLGQIWATADPNNHMCLTDIGQFHLILRLVALTQDGLVEHELTRAFREEGGKVTPVSVMEKTLWMSAHNYDCPLATFEGIEKAMVDALLSGLDLSSGATPAPAPMPLPTPAPLPKKVRHSPDETSPSSTPKKRAPRSSTSVSFQNDIHTTPATSAASTPSTAATGTSSASKRKKSPTKKPSALESTINQIESLSIDSTNIQDADKLSELDPLQFELVQEQRALQLSLMESIEENTEKKDQVAQQKPPLTAAPPPPPQSATQQNWLRMRPTDDFSQAETLQVGNKSSPKELPPKKNPPPKKSPPRKAPPKKAPPAEFDDMVHDYLLEEQAAIALSLQSLQETETNKCITPRTPPSPKATEPVAKKPPANVEFEKKPRARAPKKQTSDDGRVDEYPQAVQELVINGFELDKAIEGYKMLGDNFDDIVLFLTADMAVKELVINGFDLHKVIQAYEVVGNNMDDLIAHLIADAS